MIPMGARSLFGDASTVDKSFPSFVFLFIYFFPFTGRIIAGFLVDFCYIQLPSIPNEDREIKWLKYYD